MREKVVYILGAGFSAPLGLPVMSTFLSRSKDLFASDPDRYEHFGAVFREIDRMAVAKNYLDVDLFNIEQLLSILDMEDFALGTSHRESFVRYLADTIKGFTPPFTSPSKSAANWEDFLFAQERTLRSYCYWLAGLFGLSIGTTAEGGALDQAEPADAGADFGIISLNYDMVLEQSLELICHQYSPPQGFRFARTTDEEGLPLAKIHGSVEPNTIVPPTWQKMAQPEVRNAWELAVTLLMEANEVRILGFSFPETDGYVKYLLSIGAMRAPHLKRIDVVCLDRHGDVAARYADFVTFSYGYRFRSMDLLGYFGSYGERSDERIMGRWHGHKRVRFQGINGHHHRMMGE